MKKRIFACVLAILFTISLVVTEIVAHAATINVTINNQRVKFTDQAPLAYS